MDRKEKKLMNRTLAFSITSGSMIFTMVFIGYAVGAQFGEQGKNIGMIIGVFIGVISFFTDLFMLIKISNREE